MCGLVGILQLDSRLPALSRVLPRMVQAVGHRGPDDSGEWYDVERGIGLGHTRLSIIDLSREGSQPMVSASGRYVIVYNGEVYNHPELRQELDASHRSWRGYSDTEVLLAAIETWGIENAVPKLAGIFAFAVWDKELQVLSLVRDRLGVKPLYYSSNDRRIIFGSELKALLCHPDFERRISRDALALYMRHNYVPAPHTIYEDARKLEAGTIVQFAAAKSGRGFRMTTQAYWSAKRVAEAGQARPLAGNPEEVADELEALLEATVRSQMVASVPVGAFLSGGIDSSLVVALMQQASPTPVKTFTIGFDEAEYNEAHHARALAEHVGTDHTELTVSSEMARATIPDLPLVFDEPFSDSSQIPTLLVSRLARQQLKVVLSGDGGDELFCGYDRYRTALRIWSKASWMPSTLQRQVMTRLSETPLALTGAGGCDLATRGEPSGSLARWAEWLARHASRMRHGDRRLFYRDLISHWEMPTELVLGSIEPVTKLTSRDSKSTLDNMMDEMMYLDSISYLPDDILVKVDRASMSVGLEARVPLLDHPVVELAWRIPLSMKMRNGTSKWILRQILSKRVPKELIDRPKQGFSVPMGDWLRGPLREWAEALLDTKRIELEGYLDARIIAQAWRSHLSGARDLSHLLWDVLVFQAWLDAQHGCGLRVEAVSASA